MSRFSVALIAIGLLALAALVVLLPGRVPDTREASAQPAQNSPLAHVTICKQTDPVNPQGFNFTWSPPSGVKNPFGLKHNGCFKIDIEPNDPYTFTEVHPLASGWKLVNIVCNSNLIIGGSILIGSNSVVMNLYPDESVTCTFTNQRCVDPPAGMRAWWPLDEGLGASTIDDIWLYNHNGTPQPGATTCRISTAYDYFRISGKAGEYLDTPVIFYASGKADSIHSFVCSAQVRRV